MCVYSTTCVCVCMYMCACVLVCVCACVMYIIISSCLRCRLVCQQANDAGEENAEDRGVEKTGEDDAAD